MRAPPVLPAFFMFTLILEVFAANVLTRLASLAAAQWLSLRSVARWGDRLLGAACGFLLTLSLTHLLPEAMESPGAEPHELGLVMLGACAFFFLFGTLLHGRGGCGGCGEGGEAGARTAGTLLIGAALHGAVDGMLVAAAFMTDSAAGWLAALAVLCHEIPQQTGYLVILLRSGFTPRKAALWCLVPVAAAAFGGVTGCAAIGWSTALLPDLLAASAASFVYITLSTLLPEAAQAVHDGSSRLKLAAALAAGAILSMLLLGAGHGHSHAGPFDPHGYDELETAAHVDVQVH